MSRHCLKYEEQSGLQTIALFVRVRQRVLRHRHELLGALK
jgi:hypothetical protein